MLNRLFQRRAVWWPTVPGWILLALAIALPAAAWGVWGEAFLEHPGRVSADVLIVEGWIGTEGVRAAHAEFIRGQYRYLVTAGGPNDDRWGTGRWNYANRAHELLRTLGVPDASLVAAPAPDASRQRTFTSAMAVRLELEGRNIKVASANIFTLGAHARRSRLVFAKVLPDAELGAIAWRPASEQQGPWWQSSERTIDLIKESAGYLYELLLNSGRRSNSPPATRGSGL